MLLSIPDRPPGPYLTAVQCLAGCFGLFPHRSIRGYKPELDTLDFAVRQELHGISVYQRYVPQIERDSLTDNLQTKESLQLGNVFDLDSATQRKGDPVVRRALNPQHPGGCLGAIRWPSLPY
jgi:hypothetical protein